MLMIRMQRIGRKNDPAFRILVLEKTSSPKAGTYNDLLGTYNPKTKELTIAADRLAEWRAKGAQVSPSLMNLLITKKIVEGTKTSVVSKNNLEKNKAKEVPAEAPADLSSKEEEAPAEEPAPEAAPAEEPVVEAAQETAA